MTRPRAIDFFCGAGGVSMGLYRAGFDVIGVDVKAQPRYPFEFVQGDALEILADVGRLSRRLCEPPAFIWASPPCQRFTRVWDGEDHKREKYPDLIEPTRAALHALRVLSCIENVPGAPIRPDLVLTGAMFDLPITRDRVFELSGFSAPFALAPQHVGTFADGSLACVTGHGPQNPWHLRRDRASGSSWKNADPELKAKIAKRNCADGWRDAMGIDWMTRTELAQAIPPAYAEFIGRAAIEAIDKRRAAA